MFAHTEKKQSIQQVTKFSSQALNIASGISTIYALSENEQFAILDKENKLFIWDCSASKVVASSGEIVESISHLQKLERKIQQPKIQKICLVSEHERSTAIECTFGSSKLDVYLEEKIKARSINIGSKINKIVASGKGEYIAFELNNKVLFAKFNLEAILALDKSSRLGLFRAKLNPIDMSVVSKNPRLKR